jgi:hypothetical protein
MPTHAVGLLVVGMLVVGMLVVNSECAGVPSKDMQEIRYTRTWVSGLLQSHAHASVGMA